MAATALAMAIAATLAFPLAGGLPALWVGIAGLALLVVLAAHAWPKAQQTPR